MTLYLREPKQFEFFVSKRFRPTPLFPNDAEKERFWSNVATLAPDECWFWNGQRDAGYYGVFRFKPPISSSHQAHRVAYVNETGADIVDFVLCHRCDNQPCVNPRHMFLGTHFHNMHDMYTKGTHRRHRQRWRETGEWFSGEIFSPKKL